MKNIILTAIAAIIITACTSTNAKPKVEPNAQTGATEQTDKQVKSNYTYATPDNYIQDEYSPKLDSVVAVLKRWDQCHREHTTANLDECYASVCLYYGNDQPRNFIIDNKQTFFNKHPQYQQYVDNVKIGNWGEAFVDLNFTKHVKATPDSDWKTYEAYLRLIGGSENEWFISWESDKTTDANLQRRREQKPPAVLQITNSTPLSAIFNDQNVGKEISTSYWDLVGLEGEPEEGPLAKAIMGCNTIGARNEINGTLRRSLNGDKNTLYVGGTCSGGPYTTRVLWIFDKQTRKLSVYPEF